MAASDINPAKRYTIALLILLLIAGGIRLAIAFTDTSILITKTLSDDSFYYFQIAKNAASGNGISFDGIEPANGFHPLWFVLLFPIFLLFGDSLTTPLHAALALEAILDVGAGFFIYLLIRTLTKNRFAGIAAATVYLLNPSVILHSVNGLETGLNLFCFAFYFWFYLATVSEEDFSAGKIILLGFLSGLLMLARTDNFIMVGIVYAHLVFLKGMIRRPFVIAASVAVAGLVVAPWIIWNLATFGSISQSSATAYSIITRGNFRARGGTELQILMSSVSNTVRLFIWTIPTDVFGWGKLLGILAGLLAGMTLVDEDKARRVWAAARLACVPLVAFTALALTHSLVRGTIKSWYFMPAATVGSIFIGVFFGAFDFSSLLSKTRSRFAALLLAAVILSGYALNGRDSWNQGMYAWQSEQLMAAKWVNEHIGEDEWVGSFNAGIIGYMSERNVINLDGLVNNAVVPYLKERNLWEYIEKRKIAYLVDSDYSILKDYRDFYGQGWKSNQHILRIATIDDPQVSWAGANLGIYRIIRQ